MIVTNKTMGLLDLQPAPDFKWEGPAPDYEDEVGYDRTMEHHHALPRPTGQRRRRHHRGVTSRGRRYKRLAHGPTRPSNAIQHTSLEMPLTTSKGVPT